MERDIACQTTLDYQENNEMQKIENPLEEIQETPKQQQIMLPKSAQPIQVRQRSFTTQQHQQPLIVLQTRTPKKQTMAHVADLRQQILDIAKKFDEIIIKEQQQKCQVNLTPEDIQEQQNAIKLQMMEIKSIKSQVDANQRRLQVSVEDKELTKLDDKLKYLQDFESKMTQEYASIKKIYAKQQKALELVSNNQVDEQEKEEKLKQLKAEKAKTKQLQEQLRQLEYQSKSSHNSCYKQVEKLKWIDNRVQEFNKKKKRKIISQDDVEILENQLAELVAEIELKNAQHQSKIRELERERKVLTNDVEVRERQLKEKEKELKLTLLKFNENKRVSLREMIIK